MNVDLKAFVGKMNTQARESLVEGVRLCALGTEPIGVFLLVAPVGKTGTALALADLLYAAHEI